MPICTYIMFRTFWLSPLIVLELMLSDFDTVTTKPKLVTIQGGKSVR